MNRAHWAKSREIVERIVVLGELFLESPARFGSGDDEGPVGTSLALDSLEGRALLAGSSVAGALRSYLRQRECGYRQAGDRTCLCDVLFGRQEENEGEQSLLITDDSLAENWMLEVRDGVAIDPVTRTAEEERKYDFELMEAGTRFPLKVELLVRADRKEQLLRGLVIALQGFERGEIPLGAHRRRGFGSCRVNKWQVRRYDLTKPTGLIGWLTGDMSGTVEGPSVSDLLPVSGTDIDRRELFLLDATLTLDSSLLIRSSSGEMGEAETMHLRSNRGGSPVSIMSGTSLAGALRARALRIAKTLGTEEKAKRLVESLFGPRINSASDEPAASRLITGETEIGNPLSLVQSRVKIDRFTGGSFPTALFDEQPVFRQEGTCVQVNIAIEQPGEQSIDAEIGLLLLLLKDLWTGDLPVGGEASVGRGRMRGLQSTLTYRQSSLGKLEDWRIMRVSESEDRLKIEGDRNRLQGFVDSFVKEMK